ncbi:prevent-host-death protein [Xaviernesmea oryzae]|uniref:Antitoxin n=1 Tax=Xaviernesmea oryzae TaxID=464029 RepID=A0A1Q9B3P4_9HYPH|nr:type II toxin-antitoxin system prevent-host-death family antitoxin [Xaviernesmea oryzae]OLP62666.1 prevent-host-death protein [Xaviernesmea oryzae]SEM27290.1 prevent-host-death family protein [Xaviernesmea oryzae]
MRQFTTGDLNKQVGDVTDAAAREPVILTKAGKPRFVLMSYEHYERMRTGGDLRGAYHVSEMPKEHRALFLAETDRLTQHKGCDDEP